MRQAVPLEIRETRGDRLPIPPDPAKVAGLGVTDELAPPDFLAPYAREEWVRLVPMLVRMRLLSKVDVNTLAAYCQAFARWKAAEEQYTAACLENYEDAKGLMVRRGKTTKSKTLIVNHMIALAHNAGWEMAKYGGELGLTPAARARIAGGAKGGRGKFDGLLVGADN